MSNNIAIRDDLMFRYATGQEPRGSRSRHNFFSIFFGGGREGKTLRRRTLKQTQSRKSRPEVVNYFGL